MKKTFIIVAAFALAAFSCQKETVLQNEVKSSEIFTVTADIAQFEAESGTKTSIDGTASTITPVWSAGDEIKLFATDGTSAIYVVSTGAGTSTATFTLKSGETALSGTFACAYYPAENALSYVDGTGITANFPNNQVYTANGTGENAGTFAAGSFPMVGVGTLNAEGNNMKLTFKSLFGLLQLNFTADSFASSIKQIDLMSSTSALSGISVVTPQASESDVPSCNPAFLYKYNYVTLTTVGNEPLDGTAKAFYIAIPAGSSITKIGVISNSNCYSVNVSKTVDRSTIKSLSSGDLQTIGFTAGLYYQESPDLAPTTVDGRTWAPVNCGYDATAHPAGLLFQWGRKYGSGYGAGWTDGDVSPSEVHSAEDPIQGNAPGTINASEESPLLFYYNPTEPMDWLTTKNDKRWNSADYPNDASQVNDIHPQKAENDPCPPGWRTPTVFELTELCLHSSGRMSGAKRVNGQKGYYFSGTATYSASGPRVFFPNTGVRRRVAGEFSNHQSEADYWTSSVNGTMACSMSCFDSDYYGEFQPFYRAHGMAVRCVQE